MLGNILPPGRRHRVDDKPVDPTTEFGGKCERATGVLVCGWSIASSHHD